MTTHRAGQFVFALFSLAALTVLHSCAQIGAPQGGPADTTPPAVDITSPASGDVLVARDASLSLQFSEPIDKNTFPGNVQISPPRTGDVEYKWSEGGRRVDVIWSDSLRDSTSYRVTLSNRVADRRGNRFPEPITFAFSTGPTLDRGEIRGQVRFEGDKSESYEILAYRMETMPDTFWLSSADYSTQSGTDGRFQLPFLRAGQYRLLVLADGNRNEHLDHGELFALAPRDFTVADEAPPDSAEYFPALHDTIPFMLRRCAASGRSAIVLSFTHPLDTNGLVDGEVSAVDSASRRPVEIEILNPTPRRPSALTLIGGWVSQSVYTFSVSGVVDLRGNALDSGTCSMSYAEPTDVLAPKIEWTLMPSRTDALTPRDPITCIFSEPIDTARFAGAATVRDTIGDPINGEWTWLDRQTLRFQPHETWPDTVLVIASLDSSRIVDLAGNVAGAGTYKWRFPALGEEQLGGIEGRVESSSSATVDFWLEARAVGSARKTQIRLSAPCRFSLSLPAGRWQLGGFVDADGDGRWNPGSITPFSHSETRVIASDTLDVRARFTLEDITLRY